MRTYISICSIAFLSHIPNFIVKLICISSEKRKQTLWHCFRINFFFARIEHRKHAYVPSTQKKKNRCQIFLSEKKTFYADFNVFIASQSVSQSARLPFHRFINSFFSIKYLCTQSIYTHTQICPIASMSNILLCPQKSQLIAVIVVDHEIVTKNRYSEFVCVCVSLNCLSYSVKFIQFASYPNSDCCLHCRNITCVIQFNGIIFISTIIFSSRSEKCSVINLVVVGLINYRSHLKFKFEFKFEIFLLKMLCDDIAMAIY